MSLTLKRSGCSRPAAIAMCLTCPSFSKRWFKLPAHPFFASTSRINTSIAAVLLVWPSFDRSSWLFKVRKKVVANERQLVSLRYLCNYVRQLETALDRAAFDFVRSDRVREGHLLRTFEALRCLRQYSFVIWIRPRRFRSFWWAPNDKKPFERMIVWPSIIVDCCIFLDLTLCFLFGN